MASRRPRVLVTRPAGQAEPLCAALQALGAEPLRLPLVTISPVFAAAVGAAVPAGAFPQERIDIYVSRNAVTHAPEPAGAPAACVVALGPATAEALAERGIAATIVADPGGGSEALLAHRAFAAGRVRGAAVRLFKGEGGRDELQRVLRERGATIHEQVVYRRSRDSDAPALLAQTLAEGPLDAVVLTSVEIADAWLAALPPPRRAELLREVLHTTISERIAAFVRGAGARRVVVAASPGAEVLARAAIVPASFGGAEHTAR